SSRSCTGCRPICTPRTSPRPIGPARSFRRRSTSSSRAGRIARRVYGARCRRGREREGRESDGGGRTEERGPTEARGDGARGRGGEPADETGGGREQRVLRRAVA